VAEELLFRFDDSSSVPPENWRFGSDCGAGSGRLDGCERATPPPPPSPSLSFICLLPEAVVERAPVRWMGELREEGKRGPVYLWIGDRVRGEEKLAGREVVTTVKEVAGEEMPANCSLSSVQEANFEVGKTIFRHGAQELYPVRNKSIYKHLERDLEYFT
jgi:hypothetical protein